MKKVITKKEQSYINELLKKRRERKVKEILSVSDKPIKKTSNERSMG